jgi:hypothetical protein
MNFNNPYHRIKFYAKVTTRDGYNASVDTWPVATISTRGEIRYTGGGFSLSNDEKFYGKSMELIIRYREIEDTMRIQIDGKPDWYFISGTPEELGRKEGLRLTIEKLNI